MIFWMLLSLLVQAISADDHEYADLMKIRAPEVLDKYVSENHITDPARKKELKELFRFRDFTGKSLDGRMINFHLKSEKGYKPARVLLLTYVAEWCKNCNYEAPYLRELYDKYHTRGLEIVVRTEYSEIERVKAFIARHQAPYPIIIGSVIAYNEREKIRLETFQYLLRSTLGDKRKWGTPFNIIILNGNLQNPYVVMGELQSQQVNTVIERALEPGS